MTEGTMAPIIFVHYGPSVFLRPVLAAARQSNPDRPIWFLGDASNRQLVPGNIQYRSFEDYSGGESLRAFRNHFFPISGSRHHFNKAGGIETWLRFVFERWFFILDFLESENIGSFWIFDSDTLIAADLSLREPDFLGLDATEQCAGCCLNGFVSSREIVRAYCATMIALYRRPQYLQAQRERLKVHSGLAFNEMDAWQTHRDEMGLKTKALGIPWNGEAFDDALAITKGWQRAPDKVRGRISVKRLARDSRGGYFAFEEKTGLPVRLATLNLSWLPDYLYWALIGGCGPTGKLSFDSAFCDEVDFSEPLSDQIIRRSREILWAAQSFLQRAPK